MPHIRADAARLIDAYGRHAAGECLFHALDCAETGNTGREAYWLEVAALVMEIQERARNAGPS
jgi:hypothetical protein